MCCSFLQTKKNPGGKETFTHSCWSEMSKSLENSLSRNDVWSSAMSPNSCSVLKKTKIDKNTSLMNISRISPLLVLMFFLMKILIGLIISVGHLKWHFTYASCIFHQTSIAFLRRVYKNFFRMFEFEVWLMFLFIISTRYDCIRFET